MKSSPLPPQAKSKSVRPFAPRPTTQMVIGCVVIPLIVAVSMAILFFYVRSTASAQLPVPANTIVLIHSAPDSSAPLLARFGQKRLLNITGRTADWRWLEIELWDGRRGWALRPLDVLVWRLKAPEINFQPVDNPTPVPTPIVEAMVSVPAATFTMGSPPSLGEEDERPAHPVHLSSFAIDRTEVTVGQYWQCVIAGKCTPPTSDASLTNPHYIADPAFDNHPVINVPWGQANAYCAWRGKRLPTEAEWEMAASWDSGRGAKLLWPWGNDTDQYEANLARTSLGEPQVVGSFPKDKSPIGALDMAGNVSEWVFDWYKVDYYSVADDTDPTGPTQRRGEGRGRGVRGGSFADPVDAARTTNRGQQAEDYGYATVGFRCAKDR